MLEGKYLDSYLQLAGKDAPKVEEGDLSIISSPVDFVGINVYRTTSYVIATNDAAGYRAVPLNASHPKMFSSWHVLGPEVERNGQFRVDCRVWQPLRNCIR